MFFLKKKKKKQSPNQKRGRRPSPEPEESSELFVTVLVGDCSDQGARAYVLPASHLTRPRLAPIVAMADDNYQGCGDVVRIRCSHSIFVDAMVWTAMEEANLGRTACCQVLAPDVATPTCWWQ